MAPWWLRTQKDEHLDDPSTIATPGNDDSLDDTSEDTPSAVSPPGLRRRSKRDFAARERTAEERSTDDRPATAASPRRADTTGQGTKKLSAVDQEANAEPPADPETAVGTETAEPTETAAGTSSEGKRKRRRRRRRRKPTGDGPDGTSPTAETGKPKTQEDSETTGDRTTGGTETSDTETGDTATGDLGRPRFDPPPKAEDSVEPSPRGVAPAAYAPSLATVATARRNVPSIDQSFVLSMADRNPAEERKLALFCDFENIALGVRASEVKKLDINLILARLLEKGKIIVKKAYADWERYNDYKRPLHEAAIELIDIPQKYYSGKNSADIKLVVDAMDLCYSKEHLDTFVILSGDSDFSPLVSKLKENNKVVIGVGIKDSSSGLLVENCDEFVFYEDIWRAAQKRPTLDNLPPQKAEVFGLMADAMLALLRENKEVLWGSLVKQTMQRKSPSFNEEYYGYGSFSEMLEDAERHKVIGLRRDQRSGNYVVTGFVN